MSNVSGAPAPFKVNDVSFSMSPLTDQDTQELNNFLKQRVLQTAREFCRGETDKNIIDATMKAAMDKAVDIDWMSDPGLLESLDPCVYLFWLGCRNNEPKKTREEFKREMMQDWESNFDEAMGALRLVNPFLTKQMPKSQVEADPT